MRQVPCRLAADRDSGTNGKMSGVVPTTELLSLTGAGERWMEEWRKLCGVLPLEAQRRFDMLIGPKAGEQMAVEREYALRPAVE